MYRTVKVRKYGGGYKDNTVFEVQKKCRKLWIFTWWKTCKTFLTEAEAEIYRVRSIRQSLINNRP